MYVQYNCNPHSSFRDLLWKRSVCQNIQTKNKQKVNESSQTYIEFTFKIFQPVHYPLGCKPHTKYCYPMLFFSKVKYDRRGENQDGG